MFTTYLHLDFAPLGAILGGSKAGSPERESGAASPASKSPSPAQAAVGPVLSVDWSRRRSPFNDFAAQGFYGDGMSPSQDQFLVNVQYYDNAAPPAYYDYGAAAAPMMMPPQSPTVMMASPMAGDMRPLRSGTVISSTEREYFEVEERREKKRGSMGAMGLMGAAGAGGAAAGMAGSSEGLVGGGAAVPAAAGLIGAAGMVGAMPLLDVSDQELSSIERDMRKMYHDRYPSEETTLTLFPERSLIIILVIIFIFVVIIVVLAVTGSGTNVPPGDYYVCTTDYCEAEGTFVSSVLSETTKPCDDFYDHVCNKFQAEHTVNLQNADIISTDTLLFKAMEDSMKSIITGTYTTKPNGGAKTRGRQAGTEKLYNLYNGCRDTSSKPSGNANKEFNSIKDDAGLSGWPFAHSSDGSDYDAVWTAAAKMCRLLGIHALAKLTVEPDPEEVDKFVVALDEPDVFLRKSDVHLDKLVNWYMEAVTTSLKEGAKIAGVADVSNHASSVVAFARKLVKSLSLPDKTIMGTNRYMTKTAKEIPMKLQKYVGIVVDMGSHPSSVRDNTRVLLKSPGFINETLEALVKDQQSYVVLNYLGFRLMVALSPYLSDSVSVLRNVWYTQFTGMYKPNVERWRACLHSIDRAVPLYLLYMYSEYLNKTSFREVVARMTTDKIGRVFTENINRTQWMDGFTRYIAQRKIMSQKILSFYPVWVAIRDKFMDHISQLPAATGTDAIKQYFTYVQHFRDDIFKAYTSQKARMKQWPGSVFDTDVMYDIQRQAIFIPMGLFNTSVPTNSSVFVVHSARYGVRLTRAMTRMIYEKNYYYDTGKVFPEMVWSETSAQNFAKKLQCFSNQYSALDDPNNPGRKVTLFP
ncbi:hypothetical protein HPB52_003906 [Rhipicephalus sanguineus]|uniref:Peptidase M13 N-terminal domain-containing protein n=1 Tax=Rhipicephalus sanguineus TaxID=34632 RepID=A0A9D4PU51_RHISA|nr:hypothetical protein HPB52_003906 [Rhipicephalus sanguineus]